MAEWERFFLYMFFKTQKYFMGCFVRQNFVLKNIQLILLLKELDRQLDYLQKYESNLIL